MKVAALLFTRASSGGGYCQSLNAIAQMQRLSAGRFDFVVYTTVRENVETLQKIGQEAICINRIGRWESSAGYLTANRILRKVRSTFQIPSALEKMLVEQGVDVAYFLSPSPVAQTFQKLNFIMTIWDNCHRDHPEFPEVRSGFEFYKRESIYQNLLGAALMTLTDSEKLSEKLAFRYGVDAERFLAMPFSSSPLLEESLSLNTEQVLSKYGLNKGYYFYPAQMWPHKNHIRILQAAAILKKDGISRQIVFAGSDKANRRYIQEQAEKLGVSNLVCFLGFLPSPEMRAVYLGSCALVMPTYFGPTNLPPQEAWELGVPVIYSKELSEQTKDAALSVDPDDEISLADAMKEVLKSEIAEDLKSKGRERSAEIEAARRSSEEELIRRLLAFSRRRECWQ